MQASRSAHPHGEVLRCRCTPEMGGTQGPLSLWRCVQVGQPTHLFAEPLEGEQHVGGGHVPECRRGWGVGGREKR